MSAMMVLMMINHRRRRQQQQHLQQQQQKHHYNQYQQQQQHLLAATTWVLILLTQCAITQQQQQRTTQQQQQQQQLQPSVQSVNLTATEATTAPTTSSAAAALKYEFNYASGKVQQQQQQQQSHQQQTEPVIRQVLTTTSEQQQSSAQQTTATSASRNGAQKTTTTTTATNQDLSASSQAVVKTATTTTTPDAVSSASGAASAIQGNPATSSATATAAAQQAASTSEQQQQQQEANTEMMSDEREAAADDGETASATKLEPTTYRPQQRPPAIAPHTSAQERERKLMNVLAARRSALHRGGFRTRVGTTGRTATSASSALVETTSKSPTDARTICIRNCTKNFTRRTTASCMRQCANFSRTTTTTLSNGATSGAATTLIVRPSSKSGNTRGTPPPSERDTNEILFTDESSHGLFVVAKEQNDTLNHIPTPEAGTKSAGGLLANKLRGRGKPALITLAPASVEEDEIQPYLYFGQKLPPLKPAMLTITSVSDEHPKLLEVSVAELATSTPASASTTTSTLSPVERSRSRYKYNMRERAVGVGGPTSFNRRYNVGVGRPNAAFLGAGVEHSAEVRQGAVPQLAALANNAAGGTTETAIDVAPVVSSTPLLINVPNEEEEQLPPTGEAGLVPPLPPSVISAHKRNEPEERRTLNASNNSTTKTTTTTTTTTPTTTTTTTSTLATPSRTSSTTTTTSTTPAPTTSRMPSTTHTAATPLRRRPSSTTSTTTMPPTTAMPPSSTAKPPRNIIEEDTERLRALGPILTQQINTDDKTNLIIFLNRSSETTTTRRPFTVSHTSTTDSSSTILRTTILTSIRSTVNPRTSSATPSAGTSGDGATIIGIVETAAAPTAEVPPASKDQQQRGDDVAIEMHRMNIVTLVLVVIGLFPLLAVVMYLVRNFVMRRRVKANEDFDVCITDQQPISPVKKLDANGKFHSDNEADERSDEVDHHTQQLHHQSQAKLRGDSHGGGGGVGSSGGHRYDEHCSVTSDHEFERSNIRLKSLLGEGNFGQVWKAEADDLSGHFGATRIVAVKTIRACSAQVSLKEEANIMRKLGSHHNVVTLLGACVESEPHMIIMEYAMRGRLLSLLRAARSANNILPASVPGGRSLAPLSPRTLAGFALDIACGMEYIAEKRIVHRDLAARNVLLDHNGVCKICDFGMSIDLDAERKRKEQEKNSANEIMRRNSQKFKFDFGGRFILNHWHHGFGGDNSQCPSGQQLKDASNGDKKSHHGNHGHDTVGKRHALPIRWMAPEALQYHSFTTETDIWAFGIVLWEIATLGSTPYSQLTGREVIRRVPQGVRPELPKEGRHEFYNLMARCWHKDPQMRPSFTQSRLEISRSLHKWVDDDSAASDYMDVSGFSEDLEHGMVYFNHRISEFECEI